VVLILVEELALALLKLNQMALIAPMVSESPSLRGIIAGLFTERDFASV
jgi:hypothetical protein